MGKTTNLRIYAMRSLFFALCFVLVFIYLLPVSFAPNSFVRPDLILLAAIALVIRRAIYIPYWLVGIVFLMADILLSKPLGLETFLALLGTEMIRRNISAFKEMVFLLEWGFVSLIILGLTLAKEVMFFFTLAMATPFKPMLAQLISSILLYPIVTGVVCVIFWVWKSQTPNLNSLGQEI